MWQRGPTSSGFLRRPLGGGGRTKGWAFGHRAISLPSFPQSADKRAEQRQANSPQPTGYWLDVREQIKQNDESSPGGSGSISDSSDLRQFFLPLPFFFFATQLGTNPIVKGDCHEYTKMLRAQVQSSVFRMMTQCYFYRTRQIICHLSDCLTNWPQSHRASGVRDAVFLLVFRFELLTCLSDLGNQKECVLCSEWNKIWKVVFISAQSKHPKGEGGGGGARIHNPNNS